MIKCLLYSKGFRLSLFIAQYFYNHTNAWFSLLYAIFSIFRCNCHPQVASAVKTRLKNRCCVQDISRKTPPQVQGNLESDNNSKPTYPVKAIIKTTVATKPNNLVFGRKINTDMTISTTGIPIANSNAISDR